MATDPLRHGEGRFFRGNLHPPALRTVPFADPLHNTFAFIARRDARLSPATGELMVLAEGLVDSLGSGPARRPGRAGGGPVRSSR